MIRGIIKFALKLFFQIYFRVEINGKENIPKNGACVIAPKHISNWDAPLLVAKIRRNDTYVLGKQELFVNSFVKFLARKTHILPIKRGANDTQATRKCIDVLKQGNMLVIFPEGTRKGIEKNGKVHRGAVAIANIAETSIIPVGISATYKPFSKVKINYGKPIDVSEKKLDKNEVKEITEEIKSKLIELSK
jgi:1-acyl-sn-glycerol-3-phosphate acyltransferase